MEAREVRPWRINTHFRKDLPFDPGRYSHLVSDDQAAPFTGSGATGIDQRTLRIPFTDMLRLLMRRRRALARYSNPISSSGSYASLEHYLMTLTPEERVGQAELLLRRPIVTIMADWYPDELPSRADLVQSAALAHDLAPPMLAAFLLAEQRDQSRNEDSAEYMAAASLMKVDTSIGLGQIRTSAVMRLDLFADLLPQEEKERLGTREVVEFLVSDEFNIFATARYLRILADSLSTKEATDIPRTVAAFPGTILSLYARNSAEWPIDNIRMLGSRYTSSPSGDQPIRDWAKFVVSAMEDVVHSGCLT